MAKSFNRYCQLIVGDEDSNEALDVSDLRVKFEITRTSVGFPNTARIEVYNLSKATRKRMTKEFDQVVLKCGYEGNFGTIFKGQIFNVFHRRSQPDYISEIYASDGGTNFRKSFTNRSYEGGVTVKRIVADLQKDMNLDSGHINADLSAVKLMGWQYCGDTSAALNQLGRSHDFSWSIQSGRLYVIGDGETIKNRPMFEITSESGMIGSPVLTERGVDVKTLLNWQLIPNEKIKVAALSQPVKFQNLYLYSPSKMYPETQGTGVYVARKITHTGDTRGKEWYTDIAGWNIGDRYKKAAT